MTEEKVVYVVRTMNQAEIESTDAFFAPKGTFTAEERMQMHLKATSEVAGIFFDLQEAIDSTEANECDIYECSYPWAVIYPLREGFCPISHIKDEIWFKYNRETERYERYQSGRPVNERLIYTW